MMFKKAATGLVFALSLLTAAAASAASPTVDEVLQVDRAGDYARAEGMMSQVLREHPNNAYAHFLQAHLLAEQGKLAAARGELESAQKLNPTLSFAKPAAVRELKSMLDGSTPPPVRQAAKAATTTTSNPSSPGIPWERVLVLVVVVGLVLTWLRARRQRASVPVASGPSPMAYPGNGGAAMPMPQAGGGMGSGIMGGLATGAAVGAGMIAGEALMHRVLGDGQHQVLSSNNPAPSNADFSPNNPQAGWDGDNFGPNNASAGWGNDAGGDDWGGGGSDDWS